MRRAAALAVAGLALLAGCSDDDEPAPAAGADRPAAREQPRTERRPPRLEPARCPAGLAGCRTATGRIAYVERVDPDGDGDAHFVLLSPEGITAPGMSVIDVKASLRPSPLPGPGDRISAAGTVATGSYGQRQIEAVVLRVAR
jgi:hypothetical protein